MQSLALHRWSRLSLTGQFALAGFLVLCMGMLVLGFWVTEKIERGVTSNTAASAALYVESFIAPLVQELASGDTIHAENRALLDELLTTSEMGRSVVSFKIWKEGGLVVYSSREAIIGQRFPVTDNLRQAWAGGVASEFDTLVDEEDALERKTGVPLLEMYCPIHEDRTGRIIAVAEFYEGAQSLRDDLFRAQLQTWFIVAMVTLAMFGALFGIVNRGSRTIERQRRDLEQRVFELSRLIEVNDGLHMRVRRASQRTAELNERYLKRVSADLHDGPAQHLSLALLRLDSLMPDATTLQPESGARTDPDIETIRSSLVDAITEIRSICTGMNLPDLGQLPLDQVVRKVAHSHERRTGTTVALELDEIPGQVPESLKICVYRFVQEGLSNAFRHAEGRGQRVVCAHAHGGLAVEVADTGPGMPAAPLDRGELRGLGLDGLRERIESLGGRFVVESVPGQGTSLRMNCELQMKEVAS